MASGVCVGVVAVGAPSWSLLSSLLCLRKPAGGFRFRRVGPLAVDVARNRLVREFLASEDQWLLMVDADAVLHPETLVRLLSWGRPLVAALAFSRYGPLLPTVFAGRPGNGASGFLIPLAEMRDWLGEHQELISSEPVVLEPAPAGSLVAVDRCGCHCVLAHRSVFQAISPPWFQAREDWAEEGVGEDFHFFEKAQGAGIQAYVDRSCMTGHLYGDRCLAARDFLVWDYASDYGAGAGS